MEILGEYHSLPTRWSWSVADLWSPPQRSVPRCRFADRQRKVLQLQGGAIL